MAYWLTGLVALAMAVVSAGGVFGAGWLYRDNPLIAATFRGQDMVTLVVALPLLVAGLRLERQGSGRGRVLWLGMLSYAMYGYLFYAVGAAFNAFFLLYVAIFGLALYTLVLAATGIDFGTLAAGRDRRATRLVAIVYLLLVAVGLGLLWTGMAISYLFTHVVPGPIVASGHPTGVVFAIDLVFIVPPMLIGAIGLIRRKRIGWVLAAVMSTSGAVYTLSLAGASIVVASAGLGTGEELPLWAVLTLLGAGTSALLLNRMQGPDGRIEQNSGSTDVVALPSMGASPTSDSRGGSPNG